MFKILVHKQTQSVPASCSRERKGPNCEQFGAGGKSGFSELEKIPQYNKALLGKGKSWSEKINFEFSR